MNKYRAWKKVNIQEMFNDVVVIDWLNNKIAIEYPNPGGNTFRIDEESLDNVILMQSTGLKDKNGVEIFEGDFIKFKHNQMSGRGFVFWNQEVGQWWIKDTREVTKKRGQRYYPFWEDCKYTVYGNIHANPELLKEV